jgi:hypothetical protein
MQPIIVPGQVYLSETLNEYAVITKANQGEIKYKGPGFSGVLDLEFFLERFGPVDPKDLDKSERASLESFLPTGAVLKTGWVQVGEIDEDEE